MPTLPLHPHTRAELVGGPKDGEIIALPWPPPPWLRVAIYHYDYSMWLSNKEPSPDDTLFSTGIYIRDGKWIEFESNQIDYFWDGEE